MSTYLSVDALKGYLRIATTDTIDDALLTQIVESVEAEQRARLIADTFRMDIARATPLDNQGYAILFEAFGVGNGPFEWDFGDGTTTTLPSGVTDTTHTYTTAGSYTVTLTDKAASSVLATLALTIALTEPVSEPSTVVTVPNDVYLAALQRGARLYARRASPEGLVGLGESGIARIPPYDRDIDALEAPWRAMVLA